MAASEKKASSKKAAVKRELSIEELTAAFLKSGGTVQEIPNGVSGQTSLSKPKHITLEKKPPPAKLPERGEN